MNGELEAEIARLKQELTAQRILSDGDYNRLARAKDLEIEGLRSLLAEKNEEIKDLKSKLQWR